MSSGKGKILGAGIVMAEQMCSRYAELVPKIGNFRVKDFGSISVQQLLQIFQMIKQKLVKHLLEIVFKIPVRYTLSFFKPGDQHPVSGVTCFHLSTIHVLV